MSPDAAAPNGSPVTQRELSLSQRALRAEIRQDTASVVDSAFARLPCHAHLARLELLERHDRDEDIARRTSIGWLQWLGIGAVGGGGAAIASQAGSIAQAIARLFGGMP